MYVSPVHGLLLFLPGAQLYWLERNGRVSLHRFFFTGGTPHAAAVTDCILTAIPRCCSLHPGCFPAATSCAVSWCMRRQWDPVCGAAGISPAGGGGLGWRWSCGPRDDCVHQKCTRRAIHLADLRHRRRRGGSHYGQAQMMGASRSPQLGRGGFRGPRTGRHSRGLLNKHWPGTGGPGKQGI